MRSISLNNWRKLHRWVGLLIGIQVLLWISGGVVMSVIPIEWVRGNHLIERVESVPTKQERMTGRYAADILDWESISWVKRAGQLALKVKPSEQDFIYLDAKTGDVLPPITQATARTLAQQQYTGKAPIRSVFLLDQLPQEVGHLRPPIYRVSFDDWISTDFYISPKSGQIKSVRSDLWRFYDFFWMLHIMDYENRENFNNWLVITAAIIALLFSASGFVLLYYTLAKPKTRKFFRKIFAPE